MRASLYDGTWDLAPADRLLIEAKHWGNRLRFAIMLLFFRARGVVAWMYQVFDSTRFLETLSFR
jgi:hypothetical protein